jgi:predicted pyridoxine 5'-phosphate oxidase superfamily flavin-nucleotide-binding protein
MPIPAKRSIAKDTRQLTPGYRRMIEASPFCALATSGPELPVSLY